ncbi:MAG TPA: HRDC domain-containing protein [Gemmatimonadales bacterium]|nr:HRDC domain-containing protein [Gemmatimonadales bacterium]
MVRTSNRRLPQRYVRSNEEFAALMRRVRREPLVAMDTEAASFHRHIDRIYLIQLSSHSETAVVDPLTVTDVSGLGTLLADPAVEVVFHDGDYDLRILDRDYGFHARRLFDTRIAAHLLGEPAVGLAALLEKHVGVTLDKKYQRADWSRRPLPSEMLEYAATDTCYLLALRERLRAELEKLGRLSWAEEEFRRLEGVRWTPGETNGGAFLRIKGARALNRRGLAVLRELVPWREAIAADLDRASFRVVSNEALLALSASPPRTSEELAKVRGLSPRLVTERGPSLLDVIQRGLTVPEKDLPRFPRSERRLADPAFDLAVERLKRARNEMAERLHLEPGVLCPKGTLEAVARARPKKAGALGDIPELRKWQAELLGERFLEALAG